MNVFGIVFHGENHKRMDTVTFDKNLWNQKIKGKSLKESLEWVVFQNFKNPCFSTSFGQEDQVITDVIFNHNLPITLFTLDTGRLFEETYDVFSSTMGRYKKPIHSFFPKTDMVEQLVIEKGPNSFYKSLENRKECCRIRKIEPLKRALESCDLWITGLRGDQSTNRSSLSFFEYDSHFNVIKFNPLIEWSLEEVNAYLEKHHVPQNKLHKKGFVSIGCAPCTRAIEPGEDIRAGRWWWETSNKECGLHKK
jgi:phosphoadenosine phosphosulfate reductase